MKPLLRRFLVATGVIASLGVIAAVSIASIADPCEYTPLLGRPSPTDRYVAELYSADCGMMNHSLMVFVRDRSAFSFSFGNSPPGTVVAVEEDLGPITNIVWEGETNLVIEYSNALNVPELRRTEWGGVRIEARRVPRAP